mgnify:CR=1 FL=1
MDWQNTQTVQLNNSLSPPPPVRNSKNYIKILIIIIIYLGLLISAAFFYLQRDKNKSATTSPPHPTGVPFKSAQSTIAKEAKEPEINVADSPVTPFIGFGKLIPTGNTSSSSTFPTAPNQSFSLSPTAASPNAQAPSIRKKPSVERQNLFIKASGNTFTPNQFTAEAYQIIDVIVTAEDKDYDIAVPEINVYKVIPKGKDFVEFQVISPGTYHIVCRDLCNGNPQASAILTVK